jgi:hypothetical protein
MKDRSSYNLRKELKSAGAHSLEISELVAVAGNLKQLKSVGKPSAKPAAPYQRRSRWAIIVPAGLTALSGLALGMALVIFSQTVLPGSWLYPVQKLSDNVAIAVHPQYRGTIMMRRAQQVQQLVAGHAGSPAVLATLADYRAEASTYKSTSANYAMFEYCKTSLRQAAVIAPNPERQAIDKALLALGDV